jgi:AcrR family transcriptional regulator
MRKTRDGEDTKQRVLLAAQDLFSRKGFSGTSLADISKKSGISDGLILHHFHNKQYLYRQVIDGLSNRYSHTLFEADIAAKTPLESMQRILSASFNFWKDDTCYERISLWAFLEGESGFCESESKFTAGLAMRIKKLQEQEIIHNRYSPMVLLTMVIGPIHFWLRYRELFKEALNLPESTEELDDIFLHQLIQIVTEMSQKQEILEERNDTGKKN